MEVFPLNVSDTHAALDVTGATKVVFVIGDPIRQVMSTRLYNRLCSERGIDAVFVPLQFSAGDFEDGLRGLRAYRNVLGIIPTIPYKSQMLGQVDAASERARAVGAVNTIRVEEDGSWLGDIFDGVGYVAGLRKAGHEPAGRRVTLIGAGGAGAAIGYELAGADVDALHISDLDPARADAVADIAARRNPGLEITTGAPDLVRAEIVVNASPVGMLPDTGCPVDTSALHPEHIVTDMIMRPAQTPLILAAEALGCRTTTGSDALAGQAEATLAFLGLAPEGAVA